MLIKITENEFKEYKKAKKGWKYKIYTLLIRTKGDQ